MTISITHDVKDGANIVTLRLNHYRCFETSVSDLLASVTVAGMTTALPPEFGKQLQVFLLAARGSIKNDRSRERSNIETIESLRAVVKAMDKPARSGAPVLRMPALAAKRGPGRPPKIAPIVEPIRRGPGRPKGSKNKVH